MSAFYPFGVTQIEWNTQLACIANSIRTRTHFNSCGICIVHFLEQFPLNGFCCFHFPIHWNSIYANHFLLYNIDQCKNIIFRYLTADCLRNRCQIHTYTCTCTCNINRSVHNSVGNLTKRDEFRVSSLFAFQFNWWYCNRSLKRNTSNLEHVIIDVQLMSDKSDRPDYLYHNQNTFEKAAAFNVFYVKLIETSQFENSIINKLCRSISNPAHNLMYQNSCSAIVIANIAVGYMLLIAWHGVYWCIGASFHSLSVDLPGLFSFSCMCLKQAHIANSSVTDEIDFLSQFTVSLCLRCSFLFVCTFM